MVSQYVCTTLFSYKEACGGHVKDDEHDDGCNPFIIHEKNPKFNILNLEVNFIPLPSLAHPQTP
jgi:hypothetical protein